MKLSDIRIFGSEALPSSLAEAKKTGGVRARNIDLLIALAPTAFWGIYIYGARAAAVIALSAIVAVIAEILSQLIFRRELLSFLDISAVVSGVMTALLLPANTDYLIVALASFIAVFLFKGVFGGIGRNPLNPAAASVSLLLLFAKDSLQVYPKIGALSLTGEASGSGVYTITPLLQGITPDTQWHELFFGNACGPIGCLSILLILAGGIYLCARRLASFKAVIGFMAGVCIVAYLMAESANAFENVLYVALTGQFLFGAFFMATDPVTKVHDTRFEVIIPLLAGALAVFIAFSTSYMLAVPFAIVITNAIARLIALLPPSQKPFGLVK